VMHQQVGSDRVLHFPYRVLHVKSRDWIVVSFYLCPLVGCKMYREVI
jgi:hypothetical protein